MTTTTMTGSTSSSDAQRGAGHASAPIVPLLIGGRWSRPESPAGGFGNVYNPSTGDVIGRTPMCGPTEVNAAVQAASRAFESWSNTPVTKRATVLFRYRELMNQHADELIQLVTKENG